MFYFDPFPSLPITPSVHVTDGTADFPNLATEQIVPPSALDVEQLEVLCDAVAASWALPESVVFDHQLKLGGEQQNELVGDRIVCSVSGWFRPHDVRYHEDVRSVSQIATADWSALLDHTDAIDFFGHPGPVPARLSDRIFISPSRWETVATILRSAAPSRRPDSPSDHADPAGRMRP